MNQEQQNKQILRETISALRGVPPQQMAELLAAVDRGEITLPGEKTHKYKQIEAYAVFSKNGYIYIGSIAYSVNAARASFKVCYNLSDVPWREYEDLGFHTRKIIITESQGNPLIKTV